LSEKQISSAIMAYLAARRIFAIRVNSGTQVLMDGGNRRAIHMAAPGTADILAFPVRRSERGKIIEGYNSPLWLEVKAEKGKQSDLQKSFQAQVEAEGHRYALVRSIDDVEALLK
jgi:hypothetical protein